MTPLEPQAALEASAVELLRSNLGYRANECDRSFDGRPGGRGAKLFVGVWSAGDRVGKSRVALDEVFGVNVTVTVQLVRPMDRWHEHRDEMEREINRVRALLNRDTWNHFWKNRANELAGRGTGATQNIGFSESMYLLGIDAWQEKAGEWFNAGQTATHSVGIAQTARFGGARLLQAVITAR